MLIICSPLSIGYLSLFTSHALVPNVAADRRALIHLRQQAGSLLTSRWRKQPRRGSALCSALWTYCTRVEVWLCLIFNKCTCVPFVSINLNSMSERDYFSTWGTVLCVCVCPLKPHHHCRLFLVLLLLLWFRLSVCWLQTCFGVKGEGPGSSRTLAHSQKQVAAGQ